MASTEKLDFAQVYGRSLPQFDPATQELRFRTVGPNWKPINDLLETVEWRDEGTAGQLNLIPVLRGTITYRRPHEDEDTDQVKLKDGDRIRCDVQWYGEWLPLWEMRMSLPPATEVSDGTTSAELADDLLLASLSDDDFTFKKTKARPNGWRYDRVVRKVCEDFGIPCNSLVRGTSWVTLDVDDISPLEAIRQVVEKEVEKTGRPLVIAWKVNRAGKFGLTIEEPTRNKALHILAEELIRARVEPTRRAELATSIVATGATKKKGGQTKKLRAVSTSAAGVRQYGYIRRRMKVHNPVDGHSDLQGIARRRLRKNLKPVRVITGLEHPGIAFMRRGDTVRVSIPSEGIVGDIGFMFVSSIVHSYTPSSYTMTLDVSYRDSLDPNVLRAQREKALRAAARAKNGKKKEK